MPINVQCPRCGGMFAVPDDMAGRQVTCQCGQAISVFAAGGAYQGGLQQTDPYRRGAPTGGGGSAGGFNPYASPTLTGGAQWVMSGSPALRTVATGLGLVLIGIALALCAVLAGFGAGFVGKAALYLAIVLSVGSRICGMIGELMCLTVPQETGAKPLIIVAVVLALFALALDILGFFEFIPMGLQLVGSLAGLASFVCFVLFMRTLANYIGRPDIAASASTVLILGGVMIGLMVVVVALAFAGFIGAVDGRGDTGLACVVALVGLAFLIVGIVFLVKYVGLLGSLRSALLRQ